MLSVQQAGHQGSEGRICRQGKRHPAIQKRREQMPPRLQEPTKEQTVPTEAHSANQPVPHLLQAGRRRYKAEDPPVLRGIRVLQEETKNRSAHPSTDNIVTTHRTGE